MGRVSCGSTLDDCNVLALAIYSLSREDAKLSVVQSFLRMGTRTALEKKLGGMVYEFEMYRKVKRVTIPVRAADSVYIFMISFDIGVDHDLIILKKVIPMFDKLTL